MRRPLLNHTEPGDVVYDPFLGSGSVLIAAEATGRICHGLEIDPGYVDVIVRRWQRLTGQAAILEPGGGTFAEVACERERDARSTGFTLRAAVYGACTRATPLISDARSRWSVATGKRSGFRCLGPGS
jgi:hypothetical protein